MPSCFERAMRCFRVTGEQLFASLRRDDRIVTGEDDQLRNGRR